jgi:uncharacterized protein YjiS (DUF1127 family)
MEFNMIFDFAVRSFVTWRNRARTRTSIEHLDDYLLRDIGLTRDSIKTAIKKDTQYPFGPNPR